MTNDERNPMTNTCNYPPCSKTLTRRVGESVSDFNKRGCCSIACANRNRTKQVPQEPGVCRLNGCHNPIMRRGNESPTHYERRLYCSTTCAQINRSNMRHRVENPLKQNAPIILVPELPRAACANIFVDPELFFPHKLQSDAEAKRVCAICPIATRDACLRFALENSEVGVWGGLSSDERAGLKRRRA